MVINDVTRVLDASADFLRALAWPTAAVTITCLFLGALKAGRLDRVLGRVDRVSAFGVEIALNPESAPRIKSDLESTFAGFRSQITTEFERQAHALHIPELRSAVLEQAVVPNVRLTAPGASTYRSTIHVRDILLEESMCQLLPYLPATSAGKPGRTFSMRFGIVGLAWRTKKPQRKELLQPGDETVITEWGFLADEALTAGYGRKSFAAIPLVHGQIVVGVFYVDSPDAEAFEPQVDDAIATAATKVGLTKALHELDVHMRERGPALRFYDA